MELNIQNWRRQGYNKASKYVIGLPQCANPSSRRMSAGCLHSLSSPLSQFCYCSLLWPTCHLGKLKRNNLLVCVIEKDSTDTKKITLKNMCKTQWIERQAANTIFFALFSCIMGWAPAVESGAPSFPPVQFRHSQHPIESSFLTSTHSPAFCAHCRWHKLNVSTHLVHWEG